MLSEAQIKKLHEEVDLHQKAIEGADVSVINARKRRSEIIAELNELSSRIDSLQTERQVVQQSIVDGSGIKSQSEQSLQAIRQKLEEDAHEKKVVEMMEKQISFNEALKARIKHHRSELNGGLDLPTNSKSFEDFLEVFSGFQRDGKTHKFSQESTSMNGAKHAYLNAIREICEKSLLKKQITADDKRQRLIVLDSFLFSPLVEKHWA